LANIPSLKTALAGLFGLIALATLLPAQSAFAEGSVDVNSGAEASFRQKLLVDTNVNAPYHHGYTVLLTYAQAGETIQMGSSAMGLGGAADIRVFAPGTSFASPTEPGMRASLTDPVFATPLFDCDTDDPGTGRIAGRAEELAGPEPNPGGYTPCEFTAPHDGIYPVVMTPFQLESTGGSNSTLANPTVTTAQGSAISIWDVTVRDAGGTVQPGRVFTDLLEMGVGTLNGTGSNFSTFVYTPQGEVYRLELFSISGLQWDLAANRLGVIDATTGAPIMASFQWGIGNSGYPPTLAPTHGEAVAPQMWEGETPGDGRYPFFFTTPAAVAISGPGGLAETRGYSTVPMAPEGGLSPGLSFHGAGGEAGSTTEGTGGEVEIDAPQLQGSRYHLTIDLDRNGTFGGGADVESEGTVGAAGASYAWDGRDANGAAAPCGTYSFQATSTLPGMHLVQSDSSNEAGVEIERQTLATDPFLGEPLAASYDDVDPYTATAVTNASPSAVADGITGPTYHHYSGLSGHTDFTDDWTSSAPVDGTGTIDVRCPAPAQPSSAGSIGGAAATTSPASGSPTHAKKHKPAKPRKHQAPAGPARLVLTMRAGSARARPSSVIGYRIVIANAGDSAARDVVVCDSPPRGQEVLRTTPQGTGEGRPCWRLGTLPAQAERTLRLTTMVADGSGPGMQTNRASATASNVDGVRVARARVLVAPLPETACGSSLASPFSGPGIAFRC
jgi:uncharacterized repeat protein (TIGR01451 family)